MSHYFEDLPVGFSFTTESRELTRDDIIRFATDWDPQPFHLDDDAAKQSHFGTLVASGWHTMLTAFNLSMQAGIWDEASMGASGMDEVRFYKPALPGDRIYVRGEVLKAERSKSRPDRGRIALLNEVFRQGDEKIASFIGNHLILTRS